MSVVMKRRLRLKQIDLFGFKSFADKTTFVFGEGVSGIVGPNGCGKSNVSDAFRWVMGEQSAKSLRGEKMHDVIFAGTDKRRPASFAEVSLTFANAGNVLALPYSEVSVSRRLTRSGESIYRLNGNPVRLKDIHSLFWDTGVGKDAFAIFEQGKIEEIILKSPEDRRPIFEQAAGIHRYRKQWQEAERKLTQTEHNLERLSDIVREVEKQMKILEQQVGEATTFKKNKARLAELEQGVIVARFKRADEGRTRSAKELGDIQERLLKINEGTAQLQDQLAEVKEGVRSRERDVSVAKEEVYKAQSGQEVKRAQGETAKARLAETEDREVALKDEFEALFVERKETKQKMEGEKQELKKHREELREAEGLYKKSQKDLVLLRNSVEKLQAQQQRAHEERVELIENVHSLAAQLRASEVRQENGEERLSRLLSEVKEIEGLEGELMREVSLKEKISHKLDKAYGIQSDALTRCQEELEKSRASIESARQQEKEIGSRLADARARERALLRLQKEMEGFSDGAKQLIKEFKLKPLAEVAAFKEEMSGVMRTYSGTLVAQSQAEASKVWKFAAKNRLTDFSLFVGKGGPKVAVSLAQEGEILKGKLRSSVSKEGTFVDERGVIFYAPASEGNTFLRAHELEELAKTIKALIKEEKAITGAIDKAQEDVVAGKEKRFLLEQEMRAVEMERAEAKFALNGDIQRLDAHRVKLSLLADEKEELGALKKRLEGEMASLEKERQSAQKTLGEREKSLEKVEEKLDERWGALRNIQEIHLQKQERYEEVRDRYRSYEQSFFLLQAKEVEYGHREKRIKQDRERLATIKRELKASLADYSKGIREVESTLKKAVARASTLEKELGRWRERLEKAEAKANVGGSKAHALEAKAHSLEVAIAQGKGVADSLTEELEERFSIPMEEALKVDYHLKGTLDESEREIKSLRRAVERADHVNLASIDEYETTKGRFDELATQVSDLTNSKKELMEIIAELDKASRQKFAETFERIRVGFQKQFQILFNGGEADLKFVGSNDVLEAGIDLVAKPPGKKMRSIKLLSGGEKCMTAMALLFAVFEVKPAPFCILDEMDAPLDDSNVQRFINVLKPFMDETQFLIITHNKLTMAVADVLYGVSMEEKGVSKRIAMKFAKKQEAVCV